MRPGRVVPAGVLVLLSMTLVSCAVPPTQVPQAQVKMRLTAEEAAYNEEIDSLVAAACRIGKISAAHVVATGLQIPGYGATEGVRPWSELHAQFETLLPPQGLESLHGALVATLASQMQLDRDYPEQVMLQPGSRLPDIDSGLNAQAQDACSEYNAFLEAVKLRPAARISTSSSPVLSVSFQPTGSPFSFAMNSTGNLSVSVADSVATPFGTMTVSASESTASPTNPRRLVVRTGRHRRVLLIDQPFEVFVPSSYGVSLASDGQQLTLTVLSRGQDDVPNENWILWTPGTEHPQYLGVIASNEPEKWRPAPGYDWVNDSKDDLRVVWTPGQRDPDNEHVIASADVRKWEPEEGWKWVNDDPHDFSVVPK